MADIKLTDPSVPTLTSPAMNDLLYAVDVSDTTDGASGSGKKISIGTLSAQSPDMQRRFPSWVTDFYDNATTGANPFVGAAVSSGTINAPTTAYLTANHPGVLRAASSTTANSGYYYSSDSASILLAGGETFELIFAPTTFTNVTQRFGFIDTNTVTDAVDGVYFETFGNSINGKTSNNSARSSTSTGLTLTAATWYRAKITINSTSLVTFEIFNEAGTQLWTNTLTTNIPSASGRGTGAGCIATNSGTTAIDLVHWDFMAVTFGGTNGLTR